MHRFALRSKFWILFREEARVNGSRLVFLLAMAAPFVLLWTLSANALLAFKEHFYLLQLGVVLIGTGLIQTEQLFSLKTGRFNTMQYLLLPVSVQAKFFTRLLWILVWSPAITIGLFLLWVPLAQQLSLWLVHAQNFPLRPFVGPRIGQVYLVYLMIIPLFIPGVLIWRGLGVLKSLLFYMVLYIVLSLLISLLGMQPQNVPAWNNLGMGVWWFAVLNRKALFLSVLLFVVPLFLTSAYLLFRDKQVQ